MSKKQNNGNNKKGRMNWKKLFNESVIIPSLISLVALGFSISSDQKSIKVESLANGIASLVSTQQYQVSQNMYGEFLRLKKVLEDIVDLSSGVEYPNIDVGSEIKVLGEIKGTAAYAIMETLIQYESFDFKKNIQIMAKNGDRLSAKELLKYAKHTLSIIESNGLLERIKDYQNKVSNLQDGNKAITSSYYNDNNKNNEKQDKNEKSLVFDSKKTQNTNQLIVSSEKFLAFVDDIFISTEQIKDPDLLYYYGIMKNDNYIISVAIEMGAEVSVTETELIAKYREEYEEYNSNKEDNSDQFNLWKFIQNNFTVIISIVAIILTIIIVVLLIALVNSRNKKKEVQRTEEQNGEAESKGQKGQEQKSDDNIVRLLTSKAFNDTYAAKRFAVPIQYYFSLLNTKKYIEALDDDHDDETTNDKPIFYVDYDRLSKIPFEQYVFFNNETDPDEKLDYDDHPPLSNTLVNNEGNIEKL